MFIPEEEYQKMMKSMPIFCVDFVFRYKNKFLLIKRTQEPVKGVFWVIGGRLRFKETIQELAERVHTREVGRYYSNFKLVGFSNYIFPDVSEARATHTPTMLYLVDVEDEFIPTLDDTSCDFTWSSELPDEMKEQTYYLGKNLSISLIFVH
jgi:colanic acid biosynthesis protein WcaH